ncbi:MAG: hypothetical protein MK052_03015 [Alphaproteobacteria bacterium]|nr:hypothetical protein [Alphaproteobacteria bacterium]
MIHKMLNRLLAMHFNEAPADHRLDRLEQDVWRKIHAASAEMVQPWYDKMALAFAVPQFRMAAIAMALVIGITVSPVMNPGPAIASSGDALGMSVFSTNSPYLTSNLIERIR